MYHKIISPQKLCGWISEIHQCNFLLVWQTYAAPQGKPVLLFLKPNQPLTQTSHVTTRMTWGLIKHLRPTGFIFIFGHGSQSSKYQSVSNLRTCFNRKRRRRKPRISKMVKNNPGPKLISPANCHDKCVYVCCGNTVSCRLTAWNTRGFVKSVLCVVTSHCLMLHVIPP